MSELNDSKKITLVWKKKDITEYVGSIQWSGAHNAAARELSFTVLNDPYDKNLKLSNQIKNADEVWLMNGSKVLFYGLICDIQRKAEIGTVDFMARDMLYNLVNSTTSGRWKKKTPEYITKCLCNDFKVAVGTLSTTKYQIKKFIKKDKSPYSIIKAAYNKAKTEKTLTPYFIHMDGDKLCVTKRGQAAVTDGNEKKAIVLKDSECIYESQFEEDASTVVDKVRVINNKRRLVNLVQDKSLIKKWGIIQNVISVDKGKGTKAAKAEIVSPERSASISAIGNLKCLAGYKVKIKDKAAGLTGTYLIINDTHTFENGIHLMSLDLKMTAVAKNPKVIQIDDLSYNSWKKRKVKCSIFGYTASGNDARGKKRDPKRHIAAAPPSVPLGTKFKYKGVTYTVTDRIKRAKFKNHLYYIGILVDKKDSLLHKALEATKVTLIAPKTKSKKKKSSSSSATKGKDGNSRAKKLAEIALSYRGKVRYVFGANNVPGGVADCSAFVSYCLRQIGAGPTGSTLTLVNIGRQVPKAQAREGDVVMFQGTYRSGPSHVGIMVDNKTFVHCSSSHHGVVTDTLDRAYWVQHFLSIRRVT